MRPIGMEQALSVDAFSGQPSTAIDWDAPGVLTVLVQGALLRRNAVETARHCRHWRDLFPNAAIVLAISVSDVAAGEVRDGCFVGLRLSAPFAHDGALRAALDTIVSVCDRVVASEPALPLPPIKSDTSKPNNVNLQLSAARAGLAQVATAHVLRVRSDLVFLGRGFLDQYAECEPFPRGDAAHLRQRVMVSWLFTLNPFTVERLPLHISDWFHFGLTSDVRLLFDVPPMTLADGIHYRIAPHDPASNDEERLFRTRLAVEQHLVFSCFRRFMPDLVLDRHNDRRSAVRSLDVLVDNFVLCDLGRTRCVFEKYERDLSDPRKTFHCLTPDHWLAMAGTRGPERVAVATPTVAERADAQAFDRHRPFPRVYRAAGLPTQVGRIEGEWLVAQAARGVLFHGPYTALPPGRYLASIEVVRADGPSRLTVRATADGGRTVLARRVYQIPDGHSGAIEIAFDVTGEGATNAEIVAVVDGRRALAVATVTILRRTGSGSVGRTSAGLGRLSRFLAGGWRRVAGRRFP